MTLDNLMNRISAELVHGPVDVRQLVDSYYPDDIEAGRLLMRAFDARLLRGRFVSQLVEFDGHISGITDDTRPIWH